MPIDPSGARAGTPLRDRQRTTTSSCTIDCDLDSDEALSAHDERCPLRTSLRPAHAVADLPAAVETVGNARIATPWDARGCAACEADFEARCERFSTLPYQPLIPVSRTVPLAACAMSPKRILQMAAIVLGTVAGTYLLRHWRPASSELAGTNVTDTPDLLPPPPLRTWAEPPFALRLAVEPASSAHAVDPEGDTDQRLAATGKARPTPMNGKRGSKRAAPARLAERALSWRATGLGDVERFAFSPLSSVNEASQTIDIGSVFGRAPTPTESERLRSIYGAVDLVVGELVALLPNGSTTALLEQLGAPLLRLVADNLDGLAADRNAVADMDRNLAFLARAIIAATPRDGEGHVIGEALALPLCTRYAPSGPIAEIDGKAWHLTWLDGGFVATMAGHSLPAAYSISAQRWRLRGPVRDSEALRIRPLMPTREQLDAKIAARLRVEVWEHQIVPRQEPGVLYNATLRGAVTQTRCIRLHGVFVPVRPIRDSMAYEAYDMSKPLRAGYPVRVDRAGGWQFGAPGDALANARQPSGPPTSHLSERLARAIPRAWLNTEIDRAHLSSPDTRGVMISGRRRRYIALDEGVVQIAAVPKHPRVYLIGLPQSDRVLCIYDRGKQQFLLVPEECAAPTRADASGEAGLTTTDLTLQQERIATRFARQRIKTSYRDGFRTWDRDAFPRLVQIDGLLDDAIETVLCYGVDQNELAMEDACHPAARPVRYAMQDLARRVRRLSIALRDPQDSARIFERFFALIGEAPDGPPANGLKQYFLQRVQATEEGVAQYVMDDCRRIWLVKMSDADLRGLTYLDDPLQRIFVDVAASGVEHDEPHACGSRCQTGVAGDGGHGGDSGQSGDSGSLLRRKAAHLLNDADDVFHMHAFEQGESLATTVRRLAKNRFNMAETRYLLKLAGPGRTRDPFRPENVAAAFDLLNTRPEVRTRLLLDNADSFAQLVLELSEPDPDRQADEPAPSPALTHALLSASAAHAQWRKAA